MKKLLAVGALGLVLGIGVAVVAQPIVVPQVVNVGPTDLFLDVVSGQPSAQGVYATAAQIAGVPGYVKVVPLTGFNLTFGNSQSYMILNPAGTLATGTITTAPNPGDGQRECISSTQTQTALTLTANTGQTINGAVTALVANTPVCYTFSRANATWDRS